MKPLRILFFGSDNFSLHFVKKLQTETKLVKKLGLVTPSSNGANSKELKQFALRNNIPTIFVPRNIDFKMTNWNLPDHTFQLGVMASFGYKLPETMIKSFPLGVINIHPSLLPKYRGAAPIQHALLNDEKETGVSLLETSSKIDCGDILYQSKIAISPECDFPNLHRRLSALGTKMLMELLNDLETYRKHKKTQIFTESTSAPKIKKSDGFFEFSHETQSSMAQKWKAFKETIPIHFVMIRPLKDIKVYISELNRYPQTLSPKKEISVGQAIVDRKKNILLVKCKDGDFVAISGIKMAKKKKTNVTDFLNGLQIKIGAENIKFR